MSLDERIDACIRKKVGNKEFALFYDGGGRSTWTAYIGNPSPVVNLGETEGEYVGIGDTAEEAVQDLYEKLDRERA